MHTPPVHLYSAEANSTRHSHSLTKRLKRTGTNTGATVPDEVELGELIENIQSFRNFRDV